SITYFKCLLTYRNVSRLTTRIEQQGVMNMEFSPWVAFTDLGFIAILLVIGTVLRAKVNFVQRLFLPASIIAGLLGLALGPNGFGLIPFSDQIAVYPGILI